MMFTLIAMTIGIWALVPLTGVMVDLLANWPVEGWY